MLAAVMLRVEIYLVSVMLRLETYLVNVMLRLETYLVSVMLSVEILATVTVGVETFAVTQAAGSLGRSSHSHPTFQSIGPLGRCFL